MLVTKSYYDRMNTLLDATKTIEEELNSLFEECSMGIANIDFTRAIISLFRARIGEIELLIPRETK